MTIAPLQRVTLAMLVVAAGCGTDADELPLEPLFHSFANAEWSEPVNLGPPINVPLVTDGNAKLSPDELSLYYDSDRTDLPGAQGARDIWVSRRACTDALNPECAWQTPVNLGPPINTPFVEGAVDLSHDGHLLFFLSHKARPNCPADPAAPDPTRPCDADIFVSWRADPNGDLGWGPPAALPPSVNTGAEDNSPVYVAVGEPGRGNLYFNRAPFGTPFHDIYSVPIRVISRGAGSGPVVETLGPVVALTELNVPDALDGGVTVRPDGREIFFTSSAQRPGGLGALDVWTSTRRSPREPWGTPRNVTALNHRMADQAGGLSHDGLTLLLTSNRDGPGGPGCTAMGLPGSCGWDIYMSTRTRKP
jgi:hypothetical protein